MVCRYFGFTADWENWGENDRMSEGWGAGKGKEGFFFPLPLPLPQFFFLSPTLGKFFTSPQLSTISRWRPEQPMEIYIHSPHQNPPALQAKKLTKYGRLSQKGCQSPASKVDARGSGKGQTWKWLMRNPSKQAFETALFK